MPDWWVVFRKQFHHWEQFRHWHAHARREVPRSRVKIRNDTRWWHLDTAYGIFVRDFRLGSPTYADTALQLLGRHGFTRPVRFHQDPTQQDKLTEWIEYLTYECAGHHWYESILRDLRPDFDKGWKRLVDSKLLRPFETEEFICSFQSGVTHQSERQKAERAVALAGSALEAADKSVDRHGGSTAAQAQKVSAARSRLNEAKESLRLVQRRNDLIIDFKRSVRGYLTQKRDVKKQEALVRWVLDEVPRVEAELRKDGLGRADLSPGRGTQTIAHTKESDDFRLAPRRSARKRGRGENADDEPPSKRPKSGGRITDSRKAQSSSIP
jgi:hypothetical protein